MKRADYVRERCEKMINVMTQYCYTCGFTLKRLQYVGSPYKREVDLPCLTSSILSLVTNPIQGIYKELERISSIIKSKRDAYF